MRSRLVLPVLLVAAIAGTLDAQPAGRSIGGSGMVSPRAIGPAAPTPVPIGGLRTRPLNSPDPQRDVYGRDGRDGRDGRFGRDGRSGRYRAGYRDGFVNGYGYGYGVADAPLARGGVVYRAPNPAGTALIRTWFPTGDRPRWRVDSALAPVQAWRDLLVNDIVCDGYGTCLEREQRVRAPWVPVCRCYLFTDALGRRWEVDER